MTDTEDERAFFDRHDAHPCGVYIVTVYPEERQGVFSTKDQVDAWLESLGERGDAVIAPYILDEPDWGNVRQQ